MIGTPLPLVYPATFVSLLGSPGDGEKRLLSQLAMMQQHGLTDLLGLQELHDDSLVTAYTQAFSSTHDFLSTSTPGPRGQVIFWLWRGSLLAAALAACAWVGTSSLTILPSVLLLALLLVSITFTLPVRCTASQFLLSETVGGLGLLIRRSKWRVLAFETRIFSHQAGDWLNAFKPRAYAAALLEEREGSRSKLLVLHAHASLGTDQHRGRQISETIAAASPQAVAAMMNRANGLENDGKSTKTGEEELVACIFLGDLNADYDDCVGRIVEPAGFVDAFTAGKGCPDAKSWNNENPLAKNGLLKVPCARVDHILHRPGKGLGTPTAARVVYNEPPYLSDHFGIRCDFSTIDNNEDSSTPGSPTFCQSTPHSGTATPEPSLSTSSSRLSSFDDADTSS